IPAERPPPGARRAVGVSAQGTIWQAAAGGESGAGAGGGSEPMSPARTAAGVESGAGSGVGSTPMSVTVRTVDTDPYTGYENAIYAADDTTVFVAYKRFLSDPSVAGYIPAELR